MCRKTWKKGNLLVSFGRSSITPFYNEDGTERKVKTMKDIMYFYYDIDIIHHNKSILSMCTHDFPKVQYLPIYIDSILNHDMENSYIVEDYKDGSFHRRIRYAHILLEDSFGLDMEYFYKIERYDYEVKQQGETEHKKWTEYILTIGEMETDNKSLYSSKEDFGKVVMIKNISSNELISLKNIALAFCEESINEYNKYYK